MKNNKAKTNEQKLKESEEKFRLIIESISDPLHVVDAELKIIYINPAFIEWLKNLGLNHEIIGKTPAEAFPFIGGKVTKEYQEVFTSKKEQFLEDSTVWNNKRIFTETKKIPILKSEKVIQIITIVRDVTERKEIELKLRESEEKYRELANLLPQVICETDVQGNLTFVNQNAYKVFGYTQNDFNRGLNALKMIVPKDRERTWRNIKKILNREDIADIEYMALRKDGSVFPAIAYASPIIQENKSVGLRIVLIDASDLKKMEEKLRESEEKYRLISENANDLIHIFNDKYELEYINEAFMKFMGYLKDDLIGKSSLEFIHPADLKRASRALREGFKRGKGNLELRLRHKNGTYRWIEISGSVYRDKKEKKKALLIGRDVSDKKKAEKELRESEEKYRYLFDNAQVGLYWSGISEGKILECNETFAKLFGYDTREECLANYNVKEHYIDPNARSVILDEIRDNKEVKNYEIHVTKKDDTPIWLSISARMHEKDNLIEGAAIDITDRKKAEMELKESEELFRTVFETAKDCIFIKDRSLRYIRINKAMEELFGVSSEDLLNKTDIEIFGLEAGKHVMEIDQRVIQGEPIEEETTKPINGIPHTFHTIKVPLKDTQGNIYGLCGFARDTSDRKIFEQKLKESEEKYRNLVNDMRDVIGKMEANGEIIYASPQTFELTGFRPEEVIGKNWFKSYVHPEDFTQIAKAIKNTDSRGGFETFNFRWLHRNGHYIHVSGRGKIIKEEGKIRYIASFRDITEQMITEQKLKASEVKYRHLFETSPYFIGLVNSEGILIDSNDAINDILSIHTIEDVLGKSFKEIFLLNEKSTHLIPIFEKFVKSVFEGVAQEGFDFRLVRSIGGYLWIHIEATLIEIEKQKLIQFIMQDITERKRSEQLLQESIEDLARNNTELEQFTYVASHDLKEPLRMILSFAQLLEKRYKDKLDEDANDFIGFITEGVVRMQDLINSLLVYSKIGKDYKEFEKVDLNDVLKDVIDNLKQLINETNAEVIYDSLPNLFVDKYQLLQIFQNLISNAIKFHGKEPPKVHVSARLDSQYWVFSIRDNGIGIKSNDFERVFVIFQRLHAKDEYDGTGIGLAICKKIVEQYGGKIWVESEVGKGSTFHFSIPKAEVRK